MSPSPVRRSAPTAPFARLLGGWLVRLLVGVLLVAPVACGDDGGGAEPDLIVQDEASDEAWLTFKDSVDQGHSTASDTKAAQLTAPTPGQTVPAATPVAFTWANPAAKPLAPHGIETGRFVWLELSGSGISSPINVVSLTSTSWTPDAATWAEITKASTVTVKIYTATMDRGVVTQGPFAPTAAYDFRIAK